MSNISPQKNARTPEQNISLRNLCKNVWLEETAILDMQMSKLPMISGYVFVLPFPLCWPLKIRVCLPHKYDCFMLLIDNNLLLPGAKLHILNNIY